MANTGKLICEICNKEMRSDNLKRHIEEKHQGKLKKCECGKSMCATSLLRHKRNYCPLRAEAKMSANESTSTTDNLMVIDQQEIVIASKVRIVTYEDGTVHYLSDPIKIGEQYFVLNPVVLIDGGFHLLILVKNCYRFKFFIENSDGMANKVVETEQINPIIESEEGCTVFEVDNIEDLSLIQMHEI